MKHGIGWGPKRAACCATGRKREDKKDEMRRDGVRVRKVTFVLGEERQPHGAFQSSARERRDGMEAVGILLEAPSQTRQNQRALWSLCHDGSPLATKFGKGSAGPMSSFPGPSISG